MMAEKKVTHVVKLQIQAGKANPAPPVGPALGPTGINIMQFCKDFNEKTAKDAGMVFPVILTVYSDKTFEYVLKTPPAAVLLKQAAKIETASGKPHKEKVGKVTLAQVEEIAKAKMQDLNASSLDSAVSMIKGTARSMGIEVIG
jgi:large subunit ribosomal protein L11